MSVRKACTVTDISTKRSAKNIVMTTLGVILAVVLVPILIMNTTIIVKSFLYPSQVPDFFGIKPFIVLSGSMEPEISIDDLVVVKEAPIQSIDVGTVIAYRTGNIVTIHKVIEKAGEGSAVKFTTQGVANNAPDQTPVTAKMLEGVHIATLPRIGGVALFMQTPTGMIVCILIPLIVLGLWGYIAGRGTKKQLAELAAAQTQQNNASQQLLLDEVARLRDEVAQSKGEASADEISPSETEEQ